jgi:DNA-binding response OmpR family regulator
MNNEPVRVLVIDDDASIRTFLSLVCRRQGWLAQTANDGAGVIEAVSAWNPDVIVLDLMMPKVSGFDVMDQLRAHDPSLLRKVILLTAVSQAILSTLTVEPELWKLVRKPFDLDDLLASIGECAEAHRPGCTSRALPRPVISAHASSM